MPLLVKIHNRANTFEPYKNLTNRVLGSLLYFYYLNMRTVLFSRESFIQMSIVQIFFVFYWLLFHTMSRSATSLINSCPINFFLSNTSLVRSLLNTLGNLVWISRSSQTSSRDMALDLRLSPRRGQTCSRKSSSFNWKNKIKLIKTSIKVAVMFSYCFKYSKKCK